MNRDVLFVLLGIGVGGSFAVHCFRAGRQELRAGVAKGMFGDYRRGHMGFWPTIVLTFGASLLGALFVGLGVMRGIALFLE